MTTLKYSVELEKDETQQLIQQFNKLIKTLIALSSPADRQREIYGEAHAGDEMAEDFFSYYTQIKSSLLGKGLIVQGNVEMLDNLDRFLDEKAWEKNCEFWNGLERHADWPKLRELARLGLVSLGKENCKLRVTYSYTRNDKGKVINQFTKTELI
jgi:hypothetical protein